MHGVGVIRVFVIRVLEIILSIVVWVVSPWALDEERRLWLTVRHREFLINLSLERATHPMTRSRTEHRELRDAIG
jgi:hypothetical protein